MRRIGLVIVMSVAAATTATTGAFALDEQRMSVPAGPGTPKSEVQEQSQKSDEGTEIRIPGLGKLGTLPKMDFGLELLYGAASDQPVPEAEPQNNDAAQQDLMIHGSVKHRF